MPLLFNLLILTNGIPRIFGNLAGHRFEMDSLKLIALDNTTPEEWSRRGTADSSR